ncbi:hypothetical protein MPTK1_4g21700 [Marchantia polymorpha subsp. ruderalis]|uniref:Uncharacterized protein n=2 Tax=Marchantia polymorpha TaxID=3197 RepID=A0AAF6BCD5_MARPO|nr:hypothetical protein MARPO_0090s0050 [Marchantia polymorpha]BBN09669.1 hypothetical protein Mp_4g21700 [Marchantia polymorpha subsp. ruderalis]|eukprot:PTQ33315.1 hypothetical protein MARPO_0090s0050 [Marchantia polymorpha]
MLIVSGENTSRESEVMTHIPSWEIGLASGGLWIQRCFSDTLVRRQWTGNDVQWNRWNLDYGSQFEQGVSSGRSVQSEPMLATFPGPFTKRRRRSFSNCSGLTYSGAIKHQQDFLAHVMVTINVM